MTLHTNRTPVPTLADAARCCGILLRQTQQLDWRGLKDYISSDLQHYSEDTGFLPSITPCAQLREHSHVLAHRCPSRAAQF